MRAGQLDQKIIIQEPVEVADGMGGVSRTWKQLAKVWANVKPASGNEKEFAEQLTGEYTNVFTIRNKPNFSESYRIIWNEENYNIRSIAKEGGRKLYLSIAAERGVAQ